jgi:hypothetical protein
VPGSGGGEVAGLAEPFQPVLADGLHRPVAGATLRRGHRQQALLGEPGQPVGDRARLQWREAGHLGGGVARERRHEHRDPAQHRLLGRLEECMAPVQHRPHRAVPVLRARPARQQPQLVGEPGGEAVEAEHGQAGGRELDRQRDPIQLPADLGGLVMLRPVQPPAHRCGPVGEQVDRFRPTAVVGE